MMMLKAEELRRMVAEATPGPWGWDVNAQFKKCELMGGNGDLSVMTFARWGMGSAAPVFWFWKGNVSDEPKRADAVAVPVLGREHHKHWRQDIDHPDARLIALAPTLAMEYAALQDRVARLEAALQWIAENDDAGDMMYHADGPFAKRARAALTEAAP